jgi:hypothetical protein
MHPVVVLINVEGRKEITDSESGNEIIRILKASEDLGQRRLWLLLLLVATEVIKAKCF